jgi:hypothetical protein
MAEHESSIGQSDDWYTPPEIFMGLKLFFDLDPCSPGYGHWVPALKVYTKEQDGLTQPWEGLVFMNPPFGGRNEHVPWLLKFFEHGNGVAIVRAYTSSDWWHAHMHHAETILFPRGKTKFIPAPSLLERLEAKVKAKDPKKTWHNAPGHGVALIGMGAQANNALRRSDLGMIWNRAEAA